MRKRKATALPRLTVMAWNRRDLAAFVGAVDQLTHQVADLVAVNQELRQELAELRKKRSDAARRANHARTPRQTPGPASDEPIILSDTAAPAGAR